MYAQSENFGFLRSLEEIANFVDRSPRTIERWLEKGFPATRIANRVVSHEELAKQWLASERGDEQAT
jgi:hypothetical protein